MGVNLSCTPSNWTFMNLRLALTCFQNWLLHLSVGFGVNHNRLCVKTGSVNAHLTFKWVLESRCIVSELNLRSSVSKIICLPCRVYNLLIALWLQSCLAYCSRATRVQRMLVNKWCWLKMLVYLLWWNRSNFLHWAFALNQIWERPLVEISHDQAVLLGLSRKALRRARAPTGAMVVAESALRLLDVGVVLLPGWTGPWNWFHSVVLCLKQLLLIQDMHIFSLMKIKVLVFHLNTYRPHRLNLICGISQHRVCALWRLPLVWSLKLTDINFFHLNLIWWTLNFNLTKSFLNFWC